jgi:hypothetical protein
VVADLTVDVSFGLGYAPTGGDAVGCFAAQAAGALLLPDVDGVTLLGAGAALRNDEVLAADNAALALRLLGRHERLVWYVPTLDDVEAADDLDDSGVVPDWLGPGTMLLALATLAFLLWRGRRLGPLVTEPLPVVVRSAETAESRGRLYRRVRDQEHAAAALRAGTRARLTAALGLPRGARGAPPADLLLELSTRTGVPEDRLRDVLLTRPVPDDAALVRLAQDLAALERMQETDRP